MPQTTHTTYHRSREDAEAAAARFLEAYPRYPYQSSARVEPCRILLRSENIEADGFRVIGTEWGAE